MYKVYTDGSCKGSKDEGGWAFILIDSDDDIIYEEKGYKGSTTAQEMEIKAICKAVSYLGDYFHDRMDIKIFSDSKYGVNGFNSWMHGWVKNGWLNSKKQTVAHDEYWKCIYSNHKKHEYKMKHVRAHRGNYFNEYVDVLARGVWKKETK